MQKNSNSLEHQTTLREHIIVAKTGMDESKFPQPKVKKSPSRRSPPKTPAVNGSVASSSAASKSMPPNHYHHRAQMPTSALPPTANLSSAMPPAIAPSASNTSNDDHSTTDPHMQSFIPPNADLTPFIPSSADLETFATNGEISGMPPATDSENALPSIYDDDLDHTKIPNGL